MNRRSIPLLLLVACLFIGGRPFATFSTDSVRPFDLSRFDDATSFVLLNSRTIRNEIVFGVYGPNLRSLVSVVTGSSTASIGPDHFESLRRVEKEHADNYQFARQLIEQIGEFFPF